MQDLTGEYLSTANKDNQDNHLGATDVEDLKEPSKPSPTEETEGSNPSPTEGAKGMSITNELNKPLLQKRPPTNPHTNNKEEGIWIGGLQIESTSEVSKGQLSTMGADDDLTSPATMVTQTHQSQTKEILSTEAQGNRTNHVEATASESQSQISANLSSATTGTPRARLSFVTRAEIKLKDQQ
jgi:hypothetical protein